MPSWRLIAFARVEKIAPRGRHVENPIGASQLAVVGESREAARMLQYGDAAIAERHRAGLLDAFDAEPGRLDGIAKALGYSKPKSAGSKRTGHSGQKLLRDYQLRRERIRTCYERYFVGQS